MTDSQRQISLPLRDVLSIIAAGELNASVSSTVYALLAKSLQTVSDEELESFATETYSTPESQAMGLGQSEIQGLLYVMRVWRDTYLPEGDVQPTPSPSQVVPTGLTLVMEASWDHATDDDQGRLLHDDPLVPVCRTDGGCLVQVPDDFEEWLDTGGNRLSSGMQALVQLAGEKGAAVLWLHAGGATYEGISFP